MNVDFEFVDTHAHLYASQFDEDRDATMQRAFSEGVKKIYLPNIDATSIDAMLLLESQYPDQCRAMIGLHPCSVNDSFEQEMKIVEGWLERRKFSAIGEIGTDAFWDKTHLDQQVDCFKRQIVLAKKYGLPVVIHSRETLDMNIDIIEHLQDGSLRGIFHCFTGSTEQAKRIIDLRFLLGIGGVLTFKNSGLTEVVSDLPAESLVLETDAPYLTPHPYRGKRNETAYLRLVAEKLADCRNTSLAEIGRITTENAMRLFRD